MVSKNGVRLEFLSCFSLKNGVRLEFLSCFSQQVKNLSLTPSLCLAAFLGLVPKQNSSGGKNRLLGISKRGDDFVRRMFIHGARSVVLHAKNKTDARSNWINALKARANVNKVSVALANKNARIAMAILLSGKRYQKVS